ncbi:phage tail assembly chaperone [Methylomicrobium sp. Wu6]|uniref:phage tail assembly chaperone n=1 Tax=Methylomicrobium sp. Wu6 TaxID=3107928 RepID=UPI002DD65549|nr:phage tail assembly chaperone [Methylomicrobium sp. Wu6]MEC4750051.1 phage tail assembly chaperone [Methylomicrobium sp. Wu6]
MFKLDTSGTYKWPVEFITIDQDGNTADQEFTGIFKRLPREEVIKMSRPVDDNGSSVTVDNLKKLRDLAAKEQKEDVIDEIDDLIDRLTAIKPAEEVLDSDVETITKYLVGWEGVDINGDTSFSPENLRLLLNGVPHIFLKITQAFYQSAMGEHKRKNSKKPRSTGR